MRPKQLVLVCGTGTDVGKTWVTAGVLTHLSGLGVTVSARKPAQSFDVDGHGQPLGGPTDAEVLASATGEHPDEVCHPLRSYRRAMAPPMAADALGLDPITVEQLVGQVTWPDWAVAVGMMEAAGGVRSPQADNGDCVDVAHVVAPDLVLLVADAGLGTISSVRLCAEALAHADIGAGGSVPLVVALNRFDGGHEIHRGNRAWLEARCGFEVYGLAEELDRLARRIAGPGVTAGNGPT